MVTSDKAAAYSDHNERLFCVDTLRVFVIAFVIIHHAAQAYGPTGGFWPVRDPAQNDWFAPFYTVNSAFGLGLLFLIAGYFVPGSYEHKGPRHFIAGRLLRLAVPLVGWVLLVQLPLIYLLVAQLPFLQLIQRLYDKGWLPLYGHLWFVAHLLLYSAVYVAWRQAFARSGKAESSRPPPPGHAAIAVFLLALALVTWIVRIRYPVDVWVPLLWVIPAEPAHLPQYIALFVAGIAAYRGDWFRKMPTSTGMVWLGIGLFVSGAVYVAHLGGPLNALMATGGLNLSSLARSTWETVLAVGLSVGLVVAFREMFSRPQRLLQVMSAASFGAYIIHPPIVLALQAGILGFALPAFFKFALVALLGIVLTFWLAHLSGKVPGLRVILATGSARS